MLDVGYTVTRRLAFNIRAPSSTFDLATLPLGFKPAKNGCLGGSGLVTWLGRYSRLPDETDKPPKGGLAVALLQPVLSCLDNQHPCGCYTPACKPDQPLFHLRRQGRRVCHIEPQLYCGGQLVDILSAWSARADENELNLLLIQVDRGGDFNHAASITARLPIHFMFLFLGWRPLLGSRFSWSRGRSFMANSYLILP